ncbi:MAG: acyl-CoA reductase [Bacteroidetes bacterium]|nr:acyl-CoA reductase [Bacteroidota bacterium]
MKKSERIEKLSLWGHALGALVDEIESAGDHSRNPLHRVMTQAKNANAWFSTENILRSMNAHVSWLEKANLEKWVANYPALETVSGNKKVGIIMAGNIPAVGFHDLLSVLISGHSPVIKCASDDKFLLPFYIEVLKKISPEWADMISVQERFTDIDAVIATGNNNSSRYFDYYFGKYPHIIRKNRNSVGILKGDETETDFVNLGEDIFAYFGLGCRNVSKLYVPMGYNFNSFFNAMEKYSELMNHNKFMNNYDYHRALYLLNSEQFLTNNFLLLREAEPIATPVSVLHFDYYEDEKKLEETLKSEEKNIQCIVGGKYLPFGTSQQPRLDEYADGVDTLEFLIGI